jgi:cell cycle sensor histidine kinase DivJ
MSHELKTPLNAIIGFADLMQMSPDLFSKEQIGEYAGVIGSAGKSLLKLINQILDLTKISAGRFPLQVTNIAVGGALWLAMDGSRAKAEQKAITLSVGDCEPDVLVRADENAFGNILVQLIDNAVTFTQAGGEVRISAARHGAMVRVTIADNGPGVAPHDLARILQPFEQAVRGTHEHVQGAGLGLPLAKALTEIQGGLLSIASTLGDGFSASVELPGA